MLYSDNVSHLILTSCLLNCCIKSISHLQTSLIIFKSCHSVYRDLWAHRKWSISVTEPTRCETCGSMCKLLLIDMVKNTGRVEQMANRYIEGKTDEYSSKRAWSSIGEQYPEALTRGVIQVQEQWSRQGQTESKRKAKG